MPSPADSGADAETLELHRFVLGFLGVLAIGLALIAWLRRAPEPPAPAPDWRTRANRALELGAARDPAAAHALALQLDDPVDAVRQNVLWALHEVTRLPWGLHTPDVLRWWVRHGARTGPQPSAPWVDEPWRPLPGGPLKFQLQRLTPGVAVAGDAPAALAFQWSLSNDTSDPVATEERVRDTYFAYRHLPDGTSLLEPGSRPPFAWATLVIRGIRFGADAIPQPTGAEEGRTLAGIRLASGQSCHELVSFPLPGAEDEHAAFLVLEARLRPEPVPILGLLWQPEAPAPVHCVIKPGWREQAPQLSAADRGRVRTTAAAAGLTPARLAIVRVHSTATTATPPSPGAGAEVASALHATTHRRHGLTRPWIYLAGIGWVLVEEVAGEDGVPGPMATILDLTLDAPLPPGTTGEFVWAVETE